VYEVGSFQISRRKLKDELFLIIEGRLDLPPIEEQKQFHRGMPDPFIAIDEGMIANKGKPQRRSFVCQRWVEVVVIERGLGLGNGGFERRTVLKPSEPAGVGHHRLI
jgi:hypothetical protein